MPTDVPAIVDHFAIHQVHRMPFVPRNFEARRGEGVRGALGCSNTLPRV
jgi:hypothetical protein